MEKWIMVAQVVPPTTMAMAGMLKKMPMLPWLSNAMVPMMTTKITPKVAIPSSLSSWLRTVH